MEILMIKRKSRLVNKSFQLRTIFSVLSISIIFFLVLIALVGINAADNNHKISNAVQKMNRAVQIEDELINSILDKSKKKSNPGITPEARKIIMKHAQSVDLIKKQTRVFEDFLGQNKLYISMIFGIVLLQGLVLYFYLMKLTYRISGPIYVMSQHMREIINGQKPEKRPLREKDEFSEFYEEFLEFTDHIHYRIPPSE